MNSTTEDFKNNYLNGECRATEVEFIRAKTSEAMDGEVCGSELTFPYSVLNPFYYGLADLDKDDTDKDHVHYDVSEMLSLWDSIIELED
ncbi:hypothetical protein [Methylobacter sp. S3L5C]|uniref:hypothetical protein n=1 Tax=Methylobacter sp. S3L5C TaxID=2839024 RepID=UPI001FAE3985|nr:hypothetical protein [Methylobacter sp. S3L5C]UOA09185.1 hypothetical protein KKZ03_02380 [Methylobacter sp. S3L5C]